MIDREIEWYKTVKILEGLYPKWETTTIQINAWKQEFRMVNPQWMREAIQKVYFQYNSNEPKPKWIKAALREVRAANTGVPLDESSQAQIQQQQRLLITEQEECEAIADQERMQSAVLGWDKQTQKKWATVAMNKYIFLQEYDPIQPETWSTTFCSFIYCIKKMKGNSNDITECKALPAAASCN